MTAAIALSSRAHRVTDSPISFFVRKALETKGLISLAAGLVDQESLPAEMIREAADHVLTDPATAKSSLQYGATQGLVPLRRRVLEHYCKAEGVAPAAQSIDEGTVVITTGSQQMLYLLGELLLDVGDIVITESPSYFVYHDALKSHGARVVPVGMDQDGMDIAALDRTLAKLAASGDLKKVKIIYTVDYFQNPSGLTLSDARRSQLVEVAKKYSTDHRILILEDAAYRELRFDGPDLASVKKYDPANEYVVYSTTFSKPLAPGLKLGYSILPRELVNPVCNLKASHDFGSSNLAQHIAERVMATGAYTEHIEALHAVYKAKRDVMLKALETEFADWPEVTWTRPNGGMFVWLTFPKRIDTGEGGSLSDVAIANGVMYVPGQYSQVADLDGNLPRHEARLSFGMVSSEEIVEGVRRLRQACRGMEK